MDIPATLIATLPGLIIGILAWFNTRKQVDTDVSSQMINNALRIVDEYQEIAKDAQSRVKSLQAEFDEYREKLNQRLQDYEDELKSQEQAIERLNARNLKLQLILAIYLHQFKIQNIEPLIHPDRWEDITIEELRLTAESLGNINSKRKSY